MSKLYKSLIAIAAVFILFELSLYFAVNDLNIWLSYGNIDSKSGIFMEVIGQLVAPLLFSMGGIIISIYHYKENSKITMPVIIGALFALTGISYGIYVFTLINTFWLTITLSIIMLVLFGFFAYLMCKVEPGRFFQLYCIALTAIVYCISVLVVITLIKITWGRIRPRDLTTIDQFTAWYLPQGYTGNTSFPSGHTGNASVVLVATMFAPLVKNKLGKIPLYVLPAIWIAFMAVNRVIIGAHYASDTLFAVAISVVLFILSKKYVLRYIANHLDD